MDFWRIYRLILAKRWIITAIVLLTGLVVFAGTALRALNKEYSAEALLQPQDPSAANAEILANGGAVASNNQNPSEQRLTNISELLILLRSSNDLTNRATALLKLSEVERRKEVFRILRKNGYFAQIDADVTSQAEQAIKSGDLLPTKQTQWVQEQKKKAQDTLTDSLAKANDDAGTFAAGGIAGLDSDISKRLRKIVSFESVEGPFSTDQNPQVVNQIRIVAKSPRAAEADLYANMVSVAFLDFYTNRSAGSVTARIELLQEKLASARKTYDVAREAVVTYRKSSSAAQFSPFQSASLANIQAYENSLNAVRQELAGYEGSVKRLQSLLAASKNTQTVPLPSAENPQVRALETRLADLRIAFRRVQESNYDMGSDVYKQAKAELDQADAELKTAKAKVFTATAPNLNHQELEAQFGQAQVKRDDAQNRVTVLAQQVTTEREKLKTLPVAAAKLADLEREAALRQDAVARLEKALADQELQAIERGRAGTVNIVSSARAELVEGMTTGQRLKIIGYGMSLAFVFAILLFIALDALDNAVKTVGDAQRLMDLPVLGQIPSHIPDLLRGPRIVALEPLSSAAESYRLLRTDLIFLGMDRSFKSLLITPVRPAQGATTTAGNLAIALAQSGRKVILIDADLRRPKLHAIFNVSNIGGLSSVLTGEVDYNTALIPTDIENLQLLPAGAPVMNPSELIGSSMMGAFLKQLRDLADYVIIDAPSPATFADGAVLASISDATLLVLRAGQVPDGTAEAQVRARLDKAQAHVLGLVLNDIEPERLLGSRPRAEYHPPLVTGSVGTAGPAPIAALPKPTGSISATPLRNESETAQRTLPRITTSRLPTATHTEPKPTEETVAQKVVQTPLVALITVGLSTLVGLLTLALSRGGR